MEAHNDETGSRGIPAAEEIAGLALALGGAVAFVLGLVRHSRLLRVFGILLALAGGGFFARRKLTERAEKIDTAEDHIRSELEDLDPVARAQVLADMTHEQM
jgi:hypothetical protein